MKRLRFAKITLAAAALLVTAMVYAPGSSAITVVTGLTAQAPVTPAPGELATVATIDSTTGQVVTEWTGPQSDKAQVIAAQRSAAGVTVPAAPAPGRPGGVTTLISRHSPCTAGTGYFEVWNYPPLVCFANSGATSVTLTSVYEVDTGNNVGGVHWICGGSSCNTGYFPKWSTIIFNAPSPTVNYVYIQ
jgi:hypothetical protein